MPALVHAKLGAYFAEKEYGVTNKGVLSAITWHTTGRPEMTMLEKIIYIAETGIITLSGGAMLQQNGASIRGNTLKYSMNKGDVEATGTPNSSGSSSGRVQIVIPPSGAKSFPGARD